ncbi:MAG: 16S rRNA (uracil1498-N3)-methyltransferase [Saprospiraceae bacterium]|jgi:16S rRNA (uracil1498-N3)-methyltransferase
MIIFNSQNINDGVAKLTDDECQHCSKVLRKKMGDFVYVTDGKGHLYTGTIGLISKKEVEIVSLVEIEKQGAPHRKGIAISPTKNIDRFEWFLEKATEIGITDIYPFLSKRSERKVIKPERLEKRMVAAMKQSKNLHKPTLHPLIALKEIVYGDIGFENKYIAHCMEPESALQKLYNSGTDAIVLIGPEGDFTEDEISLAAANKWIEVSLGKSRLRTETAGLVACHLLNL